MTREIKFRAYNGEKMLFYNSWFTLDEQRTLCFEETEEHRYVDDSDVDYPSRVTLMQYTNLKDKNGKEIYEGDIIRQRGNDWGEVFEVPEIDFLNGWTKLALSEPFEIIGNIYENPKLLKK